jgi:hypothetical protein
MTNITVNIKYYNLYLYACRLIDKIGRVVSAGWGAGGKNIPWQKKLKILVNYKAG